MARSSTRLALVRLLKRDGPQTTAQLAAVLGVSSVAVRKHLHALAREGAVAVEIAKRPMGRPVHRYTHTERAAAYLPQGHHELLLAVLDVLQREDPDAAERVLAGCTAKLHARYAACLAGKSLPEQVAELARLREEDGFLTSLECAGEIITLREYHCPIRDVAERYPAACRCEQELFRELLGGQVEYVASLLEGAPACTYRIPLTSCENRPAPWAATQ
jgi:predicted ArsR family transcriptional regulator